MANINSTFEEIKRTYNLILYAESIGYQINKLASTKNIYSGKIIEMRLLDSSGSKIDEILVKYIDSKWYYRNRFNNQDWGSIIDFVAQKVLNTDNISQVANYLSSDTIANNFKRLNHQKQKHNLKYKVIELPEDRISFFELDPYDYKHTYLNKRGITDQTLKSDLFSNCLMSYPYKWKNNATGYHVAFPIHDIDHKLSGALIKNEVGKIIINYLLPHSQNQNSLFMSNYPKGYSYDIFISETPIELLSYYQLYKKEYFYIGMMGSHTPKKYDIINNEIFNKRFSGKIILANNNDLPGLIFNLQILNQFQSKTGLTISPRLVDKNQKAEIELVLPRRHNKSIDLIEEVIMKKTELKPSKKNSSSIIYSIDDLLHDKSIILQTEIVNIYQSVHNIVISVPFNNDYNDDLKKLKQNNYAKLPENFISEP
jgi:hypothetical protein